MLHFSSYLVEENVFLQNQTVIVNSVCILPDLFTDLLAFVLNMTNFRYSKKEMVNFIICLVAVWQTEYVHTN